MVILETTDLKEILQRNQNGEFGPRDRAALSMAALMGLTASELSLITVGDVIQADGKMRKTAIIPAGIAFNGCDREIPLEHPVLMNAITLYLQWRIDRDWGLVNSARFNGIDPNTPFILNDKGEGLSFSRRNKSDKDKTQPTGMNALIRRLIGRTKYNGSVTYTDFRRSFIVHFIIQMILKNYYHYN